MLGRPIRRGGRAVALVGGLASACAKFTAEDPAVAPDAAAPDATASDAATAPEVDAAVQPLDCGAELFCDDFERIDPAMPPWIASANGTAVRLTTDAPGFPDGGRALLVAVDTTAKPDFDTRFLERTLTQPKLLATRRFEMSFALRAKTIPANQLNVVEVDFTIPGTENVVTVVVAVRAQAIALASISSNKDDYSEIPMNIDASVWRTYRLAVSNTTIALYADSGQMVVSPFGTKIVELPKIVRIGVSYTDMQPSRGEVLVDDVVMPR